MKVICIDTDAWPPNLSYEPEIVDNIKLGETYTVTNVVFADGYIWYYIDNDDSGAYWENCFARCSDIDEKELIKERQTEVTVIN